MILKLLKLFTFQDWRPIVESSHVSIVREGTLCSLIINDPFWCDCGIYSVAAINDAGTTTTSCSVTIEGSIIIIIVILLIINLYRQFHTAVNV